MRPTLLTAAAMASLALASAPARADDTKAACLDAATKGQELKIAHKLVEAREKLRACAAAGCPAVVQSDCASFLADVEKALPTVVVSAKDAAGADLVDVRVTVDGQPFATKLDGQAVPMNAGVHTFRFEAADGSRVDRQVVVVEGEKDERVAVVLEAPAAVPAPAPGAAPAPATGTESAPATAPATASGPWRTVGWVLGGAGVVGLGVGTVFGLVAMGDKNGAHCDASNVCDPGTTGGIKSAALASDVGWIAGGVLLAAGAALVLWAPHGESGGSVGSVTIVPTFVSGGGGLGARGSFE